MTNAMPPLRDALGAQPGVVVLNPTTDDACRTEFTPGQAARMVEITTSSAHRPDRVRQGSFASAALTMSSTVSLPFSHCPPGARTEDGL